MTMHMTVPLYPDVREADGSPCLYVYLPPKADQPSKAVVICGGGGFNRVSMDQEGHQFARWLADIGVAGIIVHYRLPRGNKEIPETDLRQALRLVRDNAVAWNIDKQGIGAAGFSIGGHTVSLLATKDDKDAQLDFTVLFYPVISMTDRLMHKVSRENLLGATPSQEEIATYSAENHVSSATPRSLLLTSDDDATVSPLNSVTYYARLKEHAVPASLHIFPSGGHAWGVSSDFRYHKLVLALVEDWLRI